MDSYHSRKRPCAISVATPSAICSYRCSPSGSVDGALHGMESIIATVSGYIGADRSSLIKLINGSGGYFVGSLGRATTHLVCWTFQGAKYDLAKKLGTCIINHRWFEDCMKAGRRLPESPYTILCGKAVGPLYWKEPQLNTNFMHISKSKTCKFPKECTKDDAILEAQFFLQSSVAMNDSGLKSHYLKRNETEGKGGRSQKVSCSKIGSCSDTGQKLITVGEVPNDVSGDGHGRVQTNHSKFLSEENLSKPGKDSNVQNQAYEAFGILRKKIKKGKNKVLEVCEDIDVKYKIPKRCIQVSSPKMEHARQRKINHSPDKVSSGILAYLSVLHDVDVEDNKNTLQNSTEDVYNTAYEAGENCCSNLLSIRDEVAMELSEEIEACNPTISSRLNSVSSTRRTHLSLSKFVFERHKKKRKLIKKGVNHTMLNYLCASIGTESENDKCIRHNSDKVPEGTEKSAHEPASAQVLCCTDATCTLTSKEPAASSLASMPYSEIACVICHTEKIASAEGLLTCGHSFCFLCIRKWALEAASKAPTCPLCKTPFDMITRRERRAGTHDLEICSQSSAILYDETVVLLGCNENWNPDQMQEPTTNFACIMCGNRDMEELLLNCSGCGCRSAHTFCLDPPLPPTADTPWFCGRCTQRRRVDTTWWYQLHQFERS